MMKIIVLALTVVLINGCANTPKPKIDQPIASQQVDETVQDQQKLVIVPKTEEFSQKLEVSEASFDPEVLYLLLTAELAGQKGQLNIALEGYLRAARQVNDARIAERAVKIALFLKAYPQAKEANDLWLKTEPNNLKARKIATMLALMEGEKAEGVSHLDFLLSKDPAGFEDSMFEIVKILSREGKSELVLDILDELAIIHPDQVSIYFVQSVLAIQEKDNELALQKINQALQIQPDWNKAVMLQAQIVASSGDSEQAINILTEAIEKWPENTKLRVILARALVRAEKFEQAIEVFEQVVESDPEDSESQYAMALLYLQEQDEAMASTIFQGLVDTPGWGDKASFQLGRLDAVNGNYERARVWFDNITQGPYVFDAKMATVSILLEQKQYQQAEQAITMMSYDNQSQEMRLILLKAEMLSKQKRYSEAYELLSTTLEVMHNQKELLYTRALIAEHLDRIDLLESDLLAILAKHPDDASALNALGYTLVDRGERLEEAEVYINKAIAIKPNDAGIIDSYGWLMFRQGRHEEALEFLQKAYEKEQEPEISGHLVEVLWVLERKDEAREIYQSAVQEYDDDEYLLRLKQEIEGLSED